MPCPKFFLHILTEPDNKTFCPIRLIALAGCLQFLGLNLANYIQHGVFDPQAFALGLGSLVTGAGIALGLKKDTPRDPDQK